MSDQTDYLLPPHWISLNNKLQRTYHTENWKSTLMVVNAIGHLAESAWHHPDLEVTYNRVVVNLSTHSENTVTDKDYALAAKIESFLQWQPALDQGVLTGPPEDPRYAYIKYD